MDTSQNHWYGNNQPLSSALNLGVTMSSRGVEKKKVDSTQSQLSERDIRLLLVICAELVNFSAKVTGEIDPAAAAMLAYVRDDIRFETLSILR
jgi:hypothetical protein